MRISHLNYRKVAQDGARGVEASRSNGESPSFPTKANAAGITFYSQKNISVIYCCHSMVHWSNGKDAVLITRKLEFNSQMYHQTRWSK